MTRTYSRRGNSVEEIELLKGLLEGGEAERKRRLAELVERYERLIAGCVRTVLRRYGAEHTPEDLEDLTNDVWLLILRNEMRKLRQYDAERGLRLASFIGLIATNHAIDFLRGRRGDGLPLELFDPMELEERDLLEEREQSELARRAMTRLTSDERAFVVEVFQEERPPEEVARTFGLAVATVYSRKVKLRQKLARLVARMAA